MTNTNIAQVGHYVVYVLYASSGPNRHYYIHYIDATNIASVDKDNIVYVSNIINFSDKNVDGDHWENDCLEDDSDTLSNRRYYERQP